MAIANQIYTVVNSINSQAFGKSAIVVTDATWVSAGNAVLSSTENKDLWVKALLDRVSKTVVAIKSYKGAGDELKKEGIEYGIALQKIAIKLKSASTNTTWKGQSEVGADAHTDPFTKSGFEVIQRIFSDFATWEVDGTIPDNQLKTAFTNPTTMGAFIAGLMTAMYNSYEVDFEACANTCRNSMIARKSLQANNKASYINVLEEYNTRFSKSLTKATCFGDPMFLKFLSARIKLTKDRMARMNVVFNDGSVERFTPADSLQITLHSELDSALSTYLEADTFHNEMVALDGYRTVPYWQGIGTGDDAYSFDNTTAIKVTITNSAGASTNVELSGVIGIIYDFDAMGVTVENRRTTSIYNPKDEYTNYFMKADMGFYNDMSEQCVVFYVADPTING